MTMSEPPIEYAAAGYRGAGRVVANPQFWEGPGCDPRMAAEYLEQRRAPLSGAVAQRILAAMERRPPSDGFTTGSPAAVVVASGAHALKDVGRLRFPKNTESTIEEQLHTTISYNTTTLETNATRKRRCQKKTKTLWASPRMLPVLCRRSTAATGLISDTLVFHGICRATRCTADTTTPRTGSRRGTEMMVKPVEPQSVPIRLLVSFPDSFTAITI